MSVRANREELIQKGILLPDPTIGTIQESTGERLTQINNFVFRLGVAGGKGDGSSFLVLDLLFKYESAKVWTHKFYL